MRAILELFDEESFIVLDCSNLLEAGLIYPYHTAIDEVEPYIIILTEGPTDIDILRPSLWMLYPHLEPYFSFMDFRSLKIEANAGALVRLVKVFKGARVNQRMLAIFDNDAAASEALRGLKIDELPKNIKVMQLPELGLAKNYPVITESGIENKNVNGFACSIEMYLGKNILTDNQGKLIPVRQGAYLNSVQSWQGTIENKKLIQEKFQKLIGNYDYAEQLPEHDWSGLKLIFSHIFKAFH